MGKHNNSKNNKKKRPNWFDLRLQQFGEDFMSKMTIEDIKKEAGRILKDMAYANIDYTNLKYLRYYADPMFVSQLMNACYENWVYNNMTAVGLNNYFSTLTEAPPVEYLNVYQIHNQAQIAYNILYEGLYNVFNYVNRCEPGKIIAQPIIDTLFIMTQNVLQYNKGMNYTFIVVDNTRRNNNDKRTRYNDSGEVQRVPDNGNS